MPQFTVAVIVGSLRKESLTKKLAAALVKRAPKNLACSFIEIGDLPLYNEDLDGNPPAPWERFRDDIRKAQGILFLTPEYNRSLPGCLKNAIDVGSRPEGKNVFDGKPAAVMSVTPYKLGAFGANHALRQTFVFLNMPVMQQPEGYIGGARELLNERGELRDKEAQVLCEKFMHAFAHWIGTIDAGARRDDFSSFMKKRERAAAAYVCGDASALDSMVPHIGDASFFPPSGGSVHGTQQVQERYDRDAKAFSPGGDSSFDVLQYGAEGDIGFWTGFQIADAKMGSADKKAHMKLRITELFRFQEGGWKLIHRHADQAADKAH